MPSSDPWRCASKATKSKRFKSIPGYAVRSFPFGRNGTSANFTGKQGPICSTCLGPAGKTCWQLETVGSGWEALERVPAAPGPDLIVLDLMRRRLRGFAHVCAGCAGFVPIFPWLCWRTPTTSQKLEAIRLGAQDYLVRPLQPQQLETAIRRSLFHYTESAESEIVADEIEQMGDDMFFVAASPSMRRLRAQAELLAQVSAPGADLGRERQRQGIGGAADSQAVGAVRLSVSQDQLRDLAR